jgi:hypothetical protein
MEVFFLKTLKVELPYHLTIPLYGTYPKEMESTYKRLIPQNMKLTKASIIRWMNKENWERERERERERAGGKEEWDDINIDV